MTEILDEEIRRTGSGISVKATRMEGQPEVVIKGKRSLYLGLTVHGKKREKMAQKNDPTAAHKVDTENIPLLWKAMPRML
jgi:hypothetical protein